MAIYVSEPTDATTALFSPFILIPGPYPQQERFPSNVYSVSEILADRVSIMLKQYQIPESCQKTTAWCQGS